MEADTTKAADKACADAEGGLFALAKSAEVRCAPLKVVAVPPPLDPAQDEWDDDAPLYEARRKIYPQRVSGVYRRIKWVVLFITLGIYYFTPFLRWDRGPDAPSQAVLIDLQNSRFYFFFIEIWPQEVYYLTGLLIIAAMALFLMNALAGRVWCGSSSRSRPAAPGSSISPTRPRSSTTSSRCRRIQSPTSPLPS